tara:strand:- start:700 stop:1128 length:429 start_codon:yes stop_codon:yes gene_type:complete
MTSLSSVNDMLSRINLTLASQPKSNTTIHDQKQLLENATLGSAFTFSESIDLRENQSNRNFRNLSVYGSTTTNPNSVNIHLAVSQDDTNFFVLPPIANMVLHQTGGSVFDYHISLSNIQFRYVKVYFSAAAAAVNLYYIASD